MSKISFGDTPSSDGVAERVLLDDLVKAENRITQLETNINAFILVVDKIVFNVNESDAQGWMSNWEANLLSGTLVAPIPYVEPEPEIEVPLTAEGLAGIDELIDPEPEYQVIAEDDVGNLTELVGEAELLAAPAGEGLVDTGTGADLEVPADVADEDALADETAVDGSEPPLSAA